MPREPTGRHQHLKPVTAEEFGVEPAREKAGPKPLWYEILERFGFPTMVACALAWGFVQYHKQVREDAAQIRTSFSEAITTLTKQQREDRLEIVKALQEQTQLLRQLNDRDRSSSSSRSR